MVNFCSTLTVYLYLFNEQYCNLNLMINYWKSVICDIPISSNGFSILLKCKNWISIASFNEKEILKNMWAKWVGDLLKSVSEKCHQHLYWVHLVSFCGSVISNLHQQPTENCVPKNCLPVPSRLKTAGQKYQFVWQSRPIYMGLGCGLIGQYQL